MKAVLITSIFLIVSACGQSPLFNHINADDLPSKNKESAEDSTTGCSLLFPTTNLCVRWKWDVMPGEDPGQGTLYFWDKQNGTSKGPYTHPSEEVFVKLWMPSMGHGSAPVQISPETDSNGNVVPGVFKAKNVYFVMPGMWEVWIQLRRDKNVVNQVKFDFQI